MKPIDIESGDPEFDEDYDPIFDDDHEMTIECPYCDGNGWNRAVTDMGTFEVECAECGGTGWE